MADAGGGRAEGGQIAPLAEILALVSGVGGGERGTAAG